MDSKNRNQVVEKRYELKEKVKSQEHQENQNNNNSPSTLCMDSSFLLSTLLSKHNEMPKKVLEEIPKSQPENTLTAVTTTDVSVAENKVQRNDFVLQSHFKKTYQLWSPFANYKKLVNQKVPLKFTPWKPMYQQMEEELALLQFVSQSSPINSDNCSICLKRNFKF